MPIAINGNGTITGVTVGGLPDGIVDTDMLAANAVNLAKLGSTTGKNGPILQVLSTTKTDTFSTTTNQTFEDITGLNVSITTTGSNKVLLQGVLSISASADTFVVARLVRTTSGSDTPIFIGDASSNRARATFGFYFDITRGQFQLNDKGFTFLDTPSAGTHTYKIQIYRHGGAEIMVNRTIDNTDSPRSGMTVSSITVSEVAA